MSNKHNQKKRQRMVKKAQKGNTNKARKPGKQTVIEEKKPPISDFWIAAIVIVLLVAAMLIVYRVAYKDKAAPIVVETPTITGTATPIAQPTEESDNVALQWSAPPEMTIDTSKDYQAILKTEKGDITIDLADDLAPTTVNNFVFLARQGYYDNITFHRVIAGFMAQSGDPTATGTGGPGYNIPDEFDPSLRHDGPGVLSMANTGFANTGGAQFFITYAAQPHLDDKHAVFGHVTEGMDVLESLTVRQPGDSVPGDTIETIEIIES